MNPTAPLTQLGRYQIVKVLGRGAMGMVCEALDPRLERRVAVKTILKSHLLDATLAQEYSTRFVREAQAAARLNHPNIVTVFDFGEQDDVAYLVMEFIRGRELASAFEAGERFALPQALRIMGELLDALDYAHAQGVVHRDIKPANVMIDATGRVKLTDFGVARVTNAGQDRTAPGTMVGTPSYMSPEQIQGLAVGSRADLFAAGIVLYQFLTGQKPFSGGGPFAIQKKIVQDDPVAPSQLDPSLPPAFDRIVRRALAKAPQDRYETAARFAAELRSVVLDAGAARTAAASPPQPHDDDATVTLRTPAAAAPPSRRVAGVPATPDVAGARARRRTTLALAAVAVLAGAGATAWRLGNRQSTAITDSAPASDAAPPAVAPGRTAVAPAPAAVPAAPAGNASDVGAAAAAHDAAPLPQPAVKAVVPSLQEAKRASAVQAGPRTMAPSGKHTDPRCADLRERLQLGEPLPPDLQSLFAKECK